MMLAEAQTARAMFEFCKGWYRRATLDDILIGE